MSIVDFKKLFISILVLLSIPLLGLAQEGDADAEDQADQKAVEEIVVTGSRIKRDTYSSISPLQVITGQMSREVGLIDPASILQESSAAGGQQIDLTFQGFVLDNGPGASNVSLRGLGSGRTLVLIDGRRVAPAGVEGAPFAADLNLIPATLVQQYDVLLDGASSVYGSDAVAGVTNIILRKDFDGLEIEGYTSSPDQSGGLSNTVSLAWGKNFDRGFFGVAAEYEDTDNVTLSQRRWSSECDKHVEIDENGMIRNDELFFSSVGQMQPTPCYITTRLAGRIQLDDFRRYRADGDPGPGSIYYTPGFTNTGIPNFSDSFNAFLDPFTTGGLDTDGDGMNDVNYYDYNLDIKGADSRDLFPEYERISVMTYGEYTLDGEMNLTPFFELQYNERKVLANSGERGQFFPWVPPTNPYSPCNPNGVRPGDCGAYFDAGYQIQGIIDDFVLQYDDTPNGLGLGLAGNAGPIYVRPIVRVAGDRNLTDTEVYQTRFVAGLRGDLPNFTPGPLEDWSFELSLVTAISKGVSSRVGIRGCGAGLRTTPWNSCGDGTEDWLNDSLFTSMIDPSTGNVVCGLDTTGDGIPDGFNADGRACVPIDMFAPSLYEGLIGEFASQAERDYLFDSRDFATDYEQTIYSLFLTGELFQMPAGAASAVVGFEYRTDAIDSIPDSVAGKGLMWGFFQDEGAVGEKFTREYYAEVEFPLLANMAAAKELNLNLSARHTTDQYYGSDTTYSGKLGWRPVDSLLVRGTYGTSFRAPNLRENFLKSQTGFSSFFDPCGIPDEALDPFTGYNPALDNRDPAVLANCLANGADPTMLDFGGFNVYSMEISAGGAVDIKPETSKSYSYGVTFDQPFFEAFDLRIGVTYYNIDISDTIVEPGGQFIINDCYTRASMDSAFCSRIIRDPAGRIDFIAAGFLNRDQALVSGTDFNVAYDQTVTMFNRPIDLAFDVTLNHPKEASETFTDEDTGLPTYDDDAGEFGYPDWQGTIAFRADISDFRFTWQTRWIGKAQQDIDFVDDFDDITGISDTCLGPPTDVLCRDVGFADDYYTHSMSVYYYGDVWTIGGGIRNVFDEEPPMVDPASQPSSVRNMPLGYGYDLNGRTYFLNIAANFQ